MFITCITPNGESLFLMGILNIQPNHLRACSGTSQLPKHPKEHFDQSKITMRSASSAKQLKIVSHGPSDDIRKKAQRDCKNETMNILFLVYFDLPRNFRAYCRKQNTFGAFAPIIFQGCRTSNFSPHPSASTCKLKGGTESVIASSCRVTGGRMNPEKTEELMFLSQVGTRLERIYCK